MKKLTYNGEHLSKIKYPLGGIGTGCISLLGDGSLSDFELFGRPDKKSGEGFAFFAVKAERGGKLIDARMLNSDFHPANNISFSQSDIHLCDYKRFSELPRFERPDFSVRFPYATVDFSDPVFPAKIRMTAFNPFIPLGDTDSSLPCAMFEFEIENKCTEEIDISLCGALENPLEYCKNSFDGDMNGRMRCLRLSSKNDARDDGQLDSKYNAKNLCIATDCNDISYQQYLTRDPESDIIEVFWQDFTNQKHFKNRVYTNYGKNDVGTICAHITLCPGEKKTVKFVISWYMRFMTNFWSPQPQTEGESDRNFVDKNRWKNYYARYFSSSFECAEYCFIHWSRLKKETDLFTDALFDTTIPNNMLEAVSGSLCTLKSRKIMRHSDGNIIDFDSLHTGSAHICNYSYAIAHLFPALERGLREISYRLYMNETGAVSAENCLPLGRKPEEYFPHADGQLGGIIKLYREFKLYGDKNWLEIMWPYAKESLDFAFLKDNGFEWDTDKTGVFSGRQPIYDGHELYRPNPYTQGLYAAALKCAYEICMILGKNDDADFYGNLFENAKEYLNTQLFNGKYYCSQSEKVSADDQLVAGWHAENIGLCDIYDKEKLLTALQYIYNNNFTEKGVLSQYYADNENSESKEQEYALGTEYALACLMMRNGMTESSLELIDAIHERYNGKAGNPFSTNKTPSSPLDATAGYTLLAAVCGFKYDLHREYLSFLPHLEFSENGYFKCFFSVGKAFGTVETGPKYIEIKILKGEFMLKRFEIFSEPKIVYYNGRKLDFKASGNTAVFDVNVKCNKEKGIMVIYD